MRTPLARCMTAATLAASLIVVAAAGAAGHAAQARAAATASVSQTLTVPLAPLAGSRVSGTATLSALGGATRITWSVTGMAPGSRLGSFLHAGTCALPSASFRYLTTLTADAAGAATATATTDLPLSLLADRDHIIEIRSAACGAIPTGAGVTAAPGTAPGVAACAFTFPDSQPLHVLPLMSGPATVTRLRAAGFTFTLTRFAGFNATVRRAFGRTPPDGDTVEPFALTLPDGHSYAGLANVVRDGGRDLVCLRGIAYRDQGNGAVPGRAPAAMVHLDGTIGAAFARVDLYVGPAHYYVYGRPQVLP